MTTPRLVTLLRVLALIVVVVSVTVFAPVRLFVAWLAPLPDDIPTQLQQALDYGFDGVILYAERKGKPAQTYTAGWHNRSEKIPARPDALFKIASIGKLYTAVAITKLIAANKLVADSTLSELFPHLSQRLPNADTITVSMLVQHRSGLANFTDTKDFWLTAHGLSDQQKLELVLDLPANFAPDSQYQYSNTNYLLLDQIIATVSGSSKPEYIQQSILTPLSLTNTYNSLHDADISRIMAGYYVGIEEDITAADYGSMLASAEDVGVFVRALNDGSLLSQQEQQLYSSLYVYQHTGLIPGYQSQALYDKDTDTVLVIFVNTSNFSDDNYWALFELLGSRVKQILAKQGK